MKIKISRILMLFFLTLTCILSTIVLISDPNIPKHYNLLFLLPLMYLVLSIVFIKIYNYIFDSIGLAMAFGLLYFRSVILPLFMCLGNYASILYNPLVLKNGSIAVLVLIYELILIFIFTYFYGKSIYKDKSFNINKEFEETDISLKLNYKISFIIILIIISIIGLIIKYPELRYYYEFLGLTTDTSVNNWYNSHNYMRESVSEYVRIWFSFWLEIVRILLLIYIIGNVRKRSKNGNYMSVFVSLLFICLNMIILSDTKAINIFTSIATTVVLIKLYPKQRKFVLNITGLSIISFIIFTFYFKSGMGYSNNSIDLKYAFNSISSTLQAYFGGPSNVMVALALPSEDISYRIFQFIKEVFESIPILPYLILDRMQISSVSRLFNNVLYGTNYANLYQIIPMVGQSSYHFTPVFAPLLSIITLLILMNIDKLLLKENRIEYYLVYTFGTIICGMSIVIYSFSIFIRVMLTYYVPVYLLLKFRVRLKKS